MLENIDPQDWAQPGADVILQRIKQQRRDGSIILLHDAGGDRSQTVDALAADPRLAADARRYHRFVEHACSAPRATRHAAVQRNGQSLTRLVSSTGFRVFHAIEEFLWAFMIVATALVVIRTLIVIWLAARFRRRAPVTNFAEPISVLIAAFNEEKVIAETLRAVLATDYAGEIEVIVVDDGSRDQTAAEVERIAAERSARSIVATGKSRESARLPARLAAVRNEIVVFLDADTQLPARHASALARAVRR